MFSYKKVDILKDLDKTVAKCQRLYANNRLQWSSCGAGGHKIWYLIVLTVVFPSPHTERGALKIILQNVFSTRACLFEPLPFTATTTTKKQPEWLASTPWVHAEFFRPITSFHAHALESVSHMRTVIYMQVIQSHQPFFLSLFFGVCVWKRERDEGVMWFCVLICLCVFAYVHVCVRMCMSHCLCFSVLLSRVFVFVCMSVCARICLYVCIIVFLLVPLSSSYIYIMHTTACNIAMEQQMHLFACLKQKWQLFHRLSDLEISQKVTQPCFSLAYVDKSDRSYIASCITLLLSNNDLSNGREKKKQTQDYLEASHFTVWDLYSRENPRHSSRNALFSPERR